MRNLPLLGREGRCQSRGRCGQKNVCRSTLAEMEMRGLQEVFEESEGLYTFRAAHRASFPQSSRIGLCCSLTQLPGMKAFHLLTILSQEGICSPPPHLSSNVHGWLLTTQVHTLHLGALRSVLNDQACSQPLGL